jgi:hypothetical protein
MAARTYHIALAGLIGMLIVGCGGDSDRGTSTTDAATTVAPPNLEQYLLQDDEVPGLKPMSSPQTDSGPPFDPLPEDGAERLKRSGYVSTTYQPAQGERIGGVSSVLLFEAEAGARDWMAYETSDEALRHQMPRSKIERFQVSDVPGAHGWTGPDLHGNAIGQVYWTQGRCMMTIAIEVEGPRVEPLSAAAKSIYERTGGTCPD